MNKFIRHALEQARDIKQHTPYWLREPTPEELESHKRLLEKQRGMFVQNQIDGKHVPTNPQSRSWHR